MHTAQMSLANMVRKQAWRQCSLQKLQVVNGPSHPGAVGPPPSKITPPPPAVPKGPSGGGPEPEQSWREILLEKGAEGWAKDIRAHSGLLLTDTTWWAAPEPPVDVPSVFWDLHCMPLWSVSFCQAATQLFRHASAVPWGGQSLTS